MPEYFGSAAGDGSFDEFLAPHALRPAVRIDGPAHRHQPPAQPADPRVVVGAPCASPSSTATREVDALHLLRALVLGEQGRTALSRRRHRRGRPAVRHRGAHARRWRARRPAPPPDRRRAARAARGRAGRARLRLHLRRPRAPVLRLRREPAAAAGQLLAAFGVTPESLQRIAQGAAATGAPQGAESETDTPTLDKFGTRPHRPRPRDGLDPVIGRALEIEQTVEILLRRTKNNPVLIGEPGVGKTAIVEGLAQRIADGDVPEALRGKRVVALDLAGMVAGTRFRGDFEERLTKVVDEIAAHKDELIVFLDELHTVVGAGSGGEGGMDAGNILKPRLARGDLHLVGATTLKEYRRIEKDAALERRFQPVTVGEPSVEDAVRILDGPQAPLRGAPRRALHRRGGPRRGRAVAPLRDRPVPARQGDRPDRPGRRPPSPRPRRPGRRRRRCSRPARRPRGGQGPRPSPTSATRRRRGSATRSRRVQQRIAQRRTRPTPPMR